MSEKQPEALRMAQLIQDGCPMDEAELVDELRRLHAENAELRKDAERLSNLRCILDWDGNGYWLPDICIKERDWGQEFCQEPTIEEMRSAIDAALSKSKEQA